MLEEITGNGLSPASATPTESALPAEVLLASLQALPDSVFLFDKTRHLSFSSIQGAQPRLVQAWKERSKPGTRCCLMFWNDGTTENCVVDRALENRQKVEFELITNDGSEVPLFLTVQPLILSDAEPGGVLVTVQDISGLRRAEAEAIAHKSFMASIADRSPDEIYAIDREQRITWVNERAEIGRSQTLLGQRFIDFVAPDSQSKVLDALNRAFDGEDTQNEIRTIRPDHTMRDVEANISPLWKNGEVDGVLVFFRDITDRKRTQALVSQSDKLRAVGELAAGVAHNLNNSLTVIKGRTQLLQLRTQDEKTLKSLQVIDEAVEDGSKTLRRILEFARRDSHQEFGQVELDDLIKTSIEIGRPKWQRRTQHDAIELRIECNGPVYVNGEAAELREVVLNLIFNAVDAMPDGGMIEVGTRAEIDSGCFWVADSGCGMAPEVVARIFEPFYTTKGEGGTGLGLSASHGIITRHQGEIFAVSEPGEGTRFEVRLPLIDQLGKSSFDFDMDENIDAILARQ